MMTSSVTGLGLECSLRDRELRVWARAVNLMCSLGGSDIHFQFSKSSLSLTTYDASVTSHANLVFNHPFFTSYFLEDGIDNLECKVPARCLLKPFRSTRFISKCATECNIQFAKDSDTLNMTIVTKFDAQIQYELRLLSESELLEIDCDNSELHSSLTCDAKFLLTTLSNFHQVKSSGDLTLKMVGSQVSLRNSMTDLVKKEGKIYTELNLSSVDFLEYNVQDDCQLTFPFRDFKTFVMFAETMRLPVTIRFQDDTKPVMALISSVQSIYTGKLILANKANTLNGDARAAEVSSVYMSNPNPVTADTRVNAMDSDEDEQAQAVTVTQGSVSLLEQPRPTSSPVPEVSTISDSLDIPAISRRNVEMTRIETSQMEPPQSNFLLSLESPPQRSPPIVRKRPGLLFPNAGKRLPPSRTTSTQSSLCLCSESDEEG